MLSGFGDQSSLWENVWKDGGEKWTTIPRRRCPVMGVFVYLTDAEPRLIECTQQEAVRLKYIRRIREVFNITSLMINLNGQLHTIGVVNCR